MRENASEVPTFATDCLCRNVIGDAIPAFNACVTPHAASGLFIQLLLARRFVCVSKRPQHAEQVRHSTIFSRRGRLGRHRRLMFLTKRNELSEQPSDFIIEKLYLNHHIALLAYQCARFMEKTVRKYVDPLLGEPIMSPGTPDQNSPQAQFEALLKRSDFFQSAMTSQRNAIADLMGTFMGLLVKSAVVDPAALITALKELDTSSGKPSDDSTRRYLIAQIREKIQS